MPEPRSNAWLSVAILAGTAAILLAIPTRAFAQITSKPARSTDPGAPARSPLEMNEQSPSAAGAGLFYKLEPGFDYFMRVELDPAMTIDQAKEDLRSQGITPVATFERVAELDPRWSFELRANPTPRTRWIGIRVAAPTFYRPYFGPNGLSNTTATIWGT